MQGHFRAEPEHSYQADDDGQRGLLRRCGKVRSGYKQLAAPRRSIIDSKYIRLVLKSNWGSLNSCPFSFEEKFKYFQKFL